MKRFLPFVFGKQKLCTKIPKIMLSCAGRVLSTVGSISKIPLTQDMDFSYLNGARSRFVKRDDEEWENRENLYVAMMLSAMIPVSPFFDYINYFCRYFLIIFHKKYIQFSAYVV